MVAKVVVLAVVLVHLVGLPQAASTLRGSQASHLDGAAPVHPSVLQRSGLDARNLGRQNHAAAVPAHTANGAAGVKPPLRLLARSPGLTHVLPVVNWPVQGRNLMYARASSAPSAEEQYERRAHRGRHRSYRRRARHRKHQKKWVVRHEKQRARRHLPKQNPLVHLLPGGGLTAPVPAAPFRIQPPQPPERPPPAPFKVRPVFDEDPRGTSRAKSVDRPIRVQSIGRASAPVRAPSSDRVPAVPMKARTIVQAPGNPSDSTKIAQISATPSKTKDSVRVSAIPSSTKVIDQNVETPSERKSIDQAPATLSKNKNIDRASSTPSKSKVTDHDLDAPSESKRIDHALATPRKAKIIDSAPATPSKSEINDRASAAPVKTKRVEQASAAPAKAQATDEEEDDDDDDDDEQDDDDKPRHAMGPTMPNKRASPASPTAHVAPTEQSAKLAEAPVKKPTEPPLLATVAPAMQTKEVVTLAPPAKPVERASPVATAAPSTQSVVHIWGKPAVPAAMPIKEPIQNAKPTLPAAAIPPPHPPDTPPAKAQTLSPPTTAAPIGHPTQKVPPASAKQAVAPNAVPTPSKQPATQQSSIVPAAAAGSTASKINDIMMKGMKWIAGGHTSALHSQAPSQQLPPASAQADKSASDNGNAGGQAKIEASSTTTKAQQKVPQISKTMDAVDLHVEKLWKLRMQQPGMPKLSPEQEARLKAKFAEKLRGKMKNKAASSANADGKKLPPSVADAEQSGAQPTQATTKPFFSATVAPVASPVVPAQQQPTQAQSFFNSGAFGPGAQPAPSKPVFAPGAFAGATPAATVPGLMSTTNSFVAATPPPQGPPTTQAPAAAGGDSEIDKYLAWIHSAKTLKTSSKPTLGGGVMFR